MRLIGQPEIDDIARGSVVLGTGGGGDPYLGKLEAFEAIKIHGAFRLIEIDELDNDAFVIFPFGIGSPVPFLERLTLKKNCALPIMQCSVGWASQLGRLCRPRLEA